MVRMADRHRQRIGCIRPADRAPGSSRRTIICTCAFSAPPVPTTASFTDLAAYSVTGIPASAGASSATPRA